MLRAGLARAFGSRITSVVSVESAGTHGLEGFPMDPAAAAESVRLGMSDGHAHVGRRLTKQMVERADLVLGMERTHRGAAVELDPSANRRAFTLTEFAAVLEQLAPGAEVAQPEPEATLQPFLLEVVAAAARSRGLVAASQPIEYDIEDPFRREPEIYRRSAEAVAAPAASIVTRLVALLGR